MFSEKPNQFQSNIPNPGEFTLSLATIRGVKLVGWLHKTPPPLFSPIMSQWFLETGNTANPGFVTLSDFVSLPLFFFPINFFPLCSFNLTQIPHSYRHFLTPSFLLSLFIPPPLPPSHLLVLSCCALV